MGTITTGIGLISGINTAQLIEQLLAIEARPKIVLQNRMSILSSRRTALLDINARLLSLQSISKGFRTDRIFKSVLATTSNESTLTASAAKGTQPGSYQFIVKQLVRNSQLLSRGFTDRDSTPLGLDSLSFEFGQGRLAVDRALENLNGGTGVDRGKIVITDRAGASATIDLTDVTSVNEVLSRINSTSGVAVTASVNDDGFVITDTSGGAGTLTIANAAGDTTATDLGIAGSDAGGVITGNDIFYISGTTRLSALNDGNGIVIRNGQYDLFIQSRDGTRQFSVDLGAIRADVDDNTLLKDLNNGAGIKIDGDEEEPDLQIVDRAGMTHEVDLTGVTTVGQFRARISSETGGAITIAVADGDHFVLSDTTGGVGLLKVQGAGPNGTAAAKNLGVLNEAGVAADTITGTALNNTVQTAAASTVQDVLDRINNAEDQLGAANAGHIVASIGVDGKSIVINDSVSGGGNLIIRGHISSEPADGGDGGAASDLGIWASGAGVAADTVNGTTIFGGLDSILTSNLNGGSGLNGATSITLTDRDGGSFTLNNIDSYATLSDIINAINAGATGGGVDIAVALNSNGTGLKVTDSSGGTGNLIVSGDAATAIGIVTDVAGVASNSIIGTNLQRRYVDEATKLSKLNYGRGVGLGSFKITDGFGQSATVSIGSDSVTLDDIIREINSRGLAINARVNDNGDGLLIEEDLTGQTSSPFVKLKIAAVNGSTATDLNIIGESTTVEGAFINGSYERVVDLDTTDDMNDVIAKINAARIPIAASVINTGSGDTPYRFNFTSQISGLAGDLIIDTGGVDLGLTSLVQAQDAKIFFGSDTAENGFLITSSSNTVKNVVEGLTINLLAASDTAVTVNVSNDTQAVVDKVTAFVEAINGAIDRIDQYDFFDTEKKTRGVLLGNPTAARVRAALFEALRAPAKGISTQYTRLSQIGITVGGEGEVKFDDAKLRAALDTDPAAVENLFTAFEATTSTSEEVAPGVTVVRDTQTFTKLGIGDYFSQLVESITNSVDGTITRADKAFESQIKLMTERIARYDVQLEAKRGRLTAQFTAMEIALGRLQNQSASLSSIAANVNLAASRFRN